MDDHQPFSYSARNISRELFERRFPDGFGIRDEANALVAWAFRNGPLEKLHAGEYSELLDNPNLSRIKNSEMRELMINACDRLEKLIRLRETDPEEYWRQIVAYNVCNCDRWKR